jgi:O-antigen/teichoic acid export membrane protein
LSLILPRIRNHRLVAEHITDPFYRSSLFLALSSVFNAGCGFFFWIIAARMYSVEAVGLATVLISSLGLVVLFSRLGFDFSIIRFFPAGDKAKILGTSLVITTLATLLMGTIYILLIDFLTPSLAFMKEMSYALVFLLIGIANSVAAMTGNALVADRNSEQYLFQNFLLALRIPFLIPLVFLGTFGILSSVGLAYFVASFFALMFLQRGLKKIRPEIDMNFIRRSLKFSSWNYASNILSAAPTLVLPIMILNTLGEEEAAKYYIAFAVANLILIIPGSLGSSLFVEGSHGEGLKKSSMRAISSSLFLMIPVILVLFFFGNRLLGLLGEDYLQAFDLLRILALSSVLVPAYSLFIPIQNVRMNIESILSINILRCILLIGLSYILVQHYGILGVGYAWMTTYGIIALVIASRIKKEGWI